MQRLLLIAIAIASVSAQRRTITSETAFTIPCNATPLPNECLANEWSGSVVEITLRPGDEIGPTRTIDPDGSSLTTEDLTESASATMTGSSGRFLSSLPTITGRPSIPAPIRPSAANSTGSGISTGSTTPTASSTGGVATDGGSGAGARMQVGSVVAVLGGLLAGLLVVL